MSNHFDVWFVKADTVYKKVPYGVVTGWAEQGRLAADDKLRPAGVECAWTRAADHPLIADFLYVPPPPAERFVERPVPISTAPFVHPTSSPERLEPIEMDVAWRKHGEDDDDDVDMIPLIDISLVLLIFFMMTATVSALSPVDVPEMGHAAELHADPDAMTLMIDQRSTGEAFYAVRVGERPPTPEDNNLPTLAEAINRLRVRVGEAKQPPEIRIACNKELPRSHVREASKELNKLQKEKRISFFGAEVNEQSK